MTSSTRATQRGQAARPIVWALAIGAVGVAGAWFTLSPAGSRASGDTVARVAVRRGPLTISVTESGTIQNRGQVVLRSEVEGRTTILRLKEEGARVEPGEVVVELDASNLEEQKAEQQIRLLNAEAAFVRAREGLAVTQSQIESNIESAELAVKFADLDLAKYVEGEHPQALQQADAEIALAKEEVERARDKVAWSKRLNEKRYLSLLELQADELALKKAELDLDLAQGKKRVLLDFTHLRNVEQLESDVDQAAAALERVKREAAADLVQAEADLKAKKQEFDRQQTRLEKIIDQIGKCRITSPVAGMVIYATTGRASWRGNDEPLEEGKEVREREELVHVPVDDSMLAEIKIHESSLDKAKVGMPVVVTVDAVAGRRFTGEVARIALLPDAASRWMNPDLKVYDTEIHLTGDVSGLRAGMSCSAEIQVETHTNVIHVPVQCVVRNDGRTVAYVVSDGQVEEREVKIGLDNNRMVHVIAGLDEGEQVLLDPPLSGDRQGPAKADDASADAGGEGGGGGADGRSAGSGRGAAAGGAQRAARGGDRGGGGGRPGGSGDAQKSR